MAEYGGPRPKIATSSGVELTPRKSRGRPPGSKNKLKQQPHDVASGKSQSAAMELAVLEIPAGCDVIEKTLDFARRRHLGLTVLGACGCVSDVTLSHPFSHAPSVTLHGPFSILSVSGTYLGYCYSSSSSTCFGITLAGAQGNVFGGIVSGQMKAASQVILVVSTFTVPTLYRFHEELTPDNQVYGGVMTSFSAPS